MGNIESTLKIVWRCRRSSQLGLMEYCYHLWRCNTNRTLRQRWGPEIFLSFHQQSWRRCWSRCIQGRSLHDYSVSLATPQRRQSNQRKTFRHGSFINDNFDYSYYLRVWGRCPASCNVVTYTRPWFRFCKGSQRFGWYFRWYVACSHLLVDNVLVLCNHSCPELEDRLFCVLAEMLWQEHISENGQVIQWLKTCCVEYFGHEMSLLADSFRGYLRTQRG